MITPGLKGQASVTVEHENTALACGSGWVEVFATPAMILLMEKAALSSVDPFLEEGYTSVGTKIEIQHLSATPVGMKVAATSELIEVNGKRLVFRVEARDQREIIGRGIHERAVVEVQKFLAKTADKK